MQHYLGRIVVICEECGERLVITDPACIRQLDRLVFECECGLELGLTDRILQGDSDKGAA